MKLSSQSNAQPFILITHTCKELQQVSKQTANKLGTAHCSATTKTLTSFFSVPSKLFKTLEYKKKNYAERFWQAAFLRGVYIDFRQQKL